MFVLIVENFGIEYIVDNHLKHLRTTLTDYYTITEDLNYFFLVSTSNENTQQTTPNAHVAFSWMVTSTTFS